MGLDNMSAEIYDIHEFSRVDGLSTDPRILECHKHGMKCKGGEPQAFVSVVMSDYVRP